MTNSKQFDNLKLKDIQLRKATIKDISKVALVLNKSYNISSIKEGEEVFLEELKKNHTYLLAEKNSEILGITTYIIHGLPKHGLAELDRIAVMPNFRNLGIGKLLFAELINSLKNDYISKNSKLRKLYLLTHEDNLLARAFYEKLGLKYETTLNSHYYKDKNECVYSIFFD